MNINVMKPSKEILTISYLTPSVIKLPCIATEKIDGIGVRGIENKPISCSNKVLPNLLLQSIWEQVSSFNGIHGELFIGDFHTTQSVVMSQTGRLRGLTLYLFDSFDNADSPYRSRLSYLKGRLGRIWGELEKADDNKLQVKIVPSIICTSLGDVKKYYNSIVEGGGEGLVLRDPESEYQFKRVTLSSKISIKLKPFSDAEATVIGVENQMLNTSESFTSETGRLKKNKRMGDLQELQMAGAFLCMDDRGRKFKVSCSTMTHDEKSLAYYSKDKLIGKTLTYSYLDTGEKNLPRSPKFLKWT